MNDSSIIPAACQDNVIHFPGFEPPEQNYSKLPHALIDALPQFKTHGELAVVLYILRHTWGFSEYDMPKRISLGEFVNGRKRKDGTRLDGGCGMSLASVKRALKAAEEHGFIVSETDDHDPGRIAKSYKLNMAHAQNEPTLVQDEQTPVQNEPPLTHTPVQNEPSYIERNLEKDTRGEKPPAPEPPKPTPAEVADEIYAPRTARAPHQFPDYGPRASQDSALRMERSMQRTHALYTAYAEQFKTPPPAPTRADLDAAWWAEDNGYTPAHIAKATAHRLKAGRGSSAFKFVIMDIHTLLQESGPVLELVGAAAPAAPEPPAARMTRAEVDALIKQGQGQQVEQERKTA